MILVGQYDSPFVRRVGVTLHLYGIPFTRNAISVFTDVDEMARINPLVRIPSLVLDSGETLIDSAAILDTLDEMVGPSRALTPPSGTARRRVMQATALAAGAISEYPGAAGPVRGCVLPIVTEVAVIPGADAWLLVEPELVLLPLPHAATSTAATHTQAPVINRVELVCHTLISPPLCADTTDVPKAVDGRRRPGKPWCPGCREAEEASTTPGPPRTSRGAGCC